jgi:hypothetical protein
MNVRIIDGPNQGRVINLPDEMSHERTLRVPNPFPERSLGTNDPAYADKDGSVIVTTYYITKYHHGEYYGAVGHTKDIDPIQLLLSMIERITK